MKPAISICICTYNRAPILQEMLTSMVMVVDTLGGLDEVVVIDNNSSDGTKHVVESFVSRLPLRYVMEPAQGLSNARNRAIDEAKNELVIFFDDDVWLGAQTLPSYRNASDEYLDYSFFGGRIDIGWPDGAPNWWVAEDLPLLNGLLVKYDLGDSTQSFELTSPMPFGANFAVRKSLVRSIGGFDPELGPLGEGIGRGDDTDFFMRALNRGYQGVYLPNARVAHRFDQQRVTLPYLVRYGKEKGKRLPKLKQPTIVAGVVFSQTARALFQLLKRRKDRAFQCVINIGIVLGRYR